MRIHSLTVSAFGPFAGTHEVDFEELNDAGVFLVTGPTGAGKTSILDAVCFALFGQVPGARGVKTLRSDHAEDDARPEVALDFTLGERRFVVRRTPEWTRPKRKGEGTTVEKAAATLLELTGGSERLISSRAQEVGHYLSDLLGMTAGQFQQVAMLPQGEFQTFLRASSQERHDVLQQLFRTERFTRIEEWVQDHSKRLRELAAAGEAAVRRLVDLMADRADVETPVRLLPEALARSASAELVLPWADELVASAHEALETAAAQHEQTTEQLRVARTQHDDAQRRQALRARLDDATQVLRRLAQDAPTDAARALLAADARAARCVPVLRLLDGSLAVEAAAREAHALAARQAPSVEDARVAAQQTHTQLARVEALLPRERELRKTRESFRAAADALKNLGPRLQRAELAMTEHPRRREALEKALATAREAAVRRPAIEGELTQLSGRAEAAQALPDAEAALNRHRDQARDARDAYADARDRMLDVISRRLAGMAAELAIKLSDGDPCQVCGSTDHPAPARFTEDSVDEAAQLAATTEADALRVVHESAVQRVQEAELRVESLRVAASGLKAVDAEGALADCRRRLAEVEQAERAADEASQQLRTLDHEAVALADQLRQLEAESTRLGHTVQTLAETASRIESEIADEVEDGSSLAEAVAGLTRTARNLEMLADAAAALARAQADTARHHEAALASAREQGFASLDEVRGAVLDDASRAAHQEAVSAHDTALREAEAVLADPDLVALTDVTVDVESAVRTLDLAVAADGAAARAHHLAQEVAAALTTQRERLVDALDAWAPARERYLTADSMARLVRGMGSDNQLQMRLSAYVLATRLDQVVAAANERLTHMREQRYLLERTGDAARKGSQAGLGLRVIDEWTGETRDPSTLSGGETFVVSLALALGLSDVVSQESGGIELGTLFIDEGFGMLDLDTLDDVMDRLDGLRAGGRTVGVVSHVTELRNRIPTQLHVDKQRHGSSVSVTTLIA
ncbi:MAG TPA: SMC family ATPase [Nocardioidaceae bacterium]|nr:SMC family ATPase [Nocardioidaceae bacterium]